MLPNNFGVPQGFVLGLLLFLIYVNNITNTVKNTPRLFADDTCLLISHNNFTTLQDNFNTKVKKVCNWCTANILTTSFSKLNAVVESHFFYKRISNFNLLVNI